MGKFKVAITGLLMTLARERGRELCGLQRTLDNFLMVVCGDEVMVVAVRNYVAIDDVVAIGSVVVVAMIVVWVQWCWMRACTNPQSHLVSAVVTLRGKKSSC